MENQVEQADFQPKKATLMDFSLDQTHGTTFYVYSFSHLQSQEALVEYNLFSPRILASGGIRSSNQNLSSGRIYGNHEYEIKPHEEFGIIPYVLWQDLIGVLG